MITKEITFTNTITGAEEKETASFHLNKVDMLRLIARSKSDTWEQHVQSIVDSKDGDKILDFIEEVIGLSYGVRDEDGKTFVKNKEAQERFVNSEPYAELVATMIVDHKMAEEFFRGVMGVREGVSAPKAVMSGKAVSKRSTRKK